MSYLLEEETSYLLMGNEAIARGAIEAGISVATGYPGTPSSEIIDNLSKISKERNIYVEWSINEKVALEVAAAASFSGLRSICAMKQNGVNVASDFLLHLAESGTRGGIVLVVCDDPGALSSANEGESRFFARLLEIPLLEPGNFQQAKDMTVWAFELSEKLKSIVIVRSVTRLSHASGNVVLGQLPGKKVHAEFCHDGLFLDPDTGPVTSLPVPYKHALQQKKIDEARNIFETCPFNTYTGPEAPDLLIIASSVCNLYAREAVHELKAESEVGILTLGTTWPLPSKLVSHYLSCTDTVLIVEEVLPFLEEQVKILAAEMTPKIGVKTFYGKTDGTMPMMGESTPDCVMAALSKILKIPYKTVPKVYAEKARAVTAGVDREVAFCPGCPHRASFWSIHTVLAEDNRKGFVCGDIGCYTMDVFPTGFSTLKTVHSMGSGLGIASGFGKLHQFGMDQPVLAVCGDSTFFHAAIPALINAVHHKSNITVVILDNGGTAMTGFQPHPGLQTNAMGDEVPAVNIEGICRAIGAKVEIRDPFNLKKTQEALKEMIRDTDGAKVLILRRGCALDPEKKFKRKYKMSVDPERCMGDKGCERVCTRVFSCPGLVWDTEEKVTKIDEVICVGCGVCESICPFRAIIKEEI
jgi:indolepyruvate ferredoxin oxidoreductase alpha subunit